MADPLGERFGAPSDFSDPSPPTPVQKFVNLHLLVGAPPPPPPPPPRTPQQRGKQRKRAEKQPLLERDDYIEDRLRAAMFDEIPALGDDPVLDSRSVGSDDDIGSNRRSKPKPRKQQRPNSELMSQSVSRSSTPKHRNTSPPKRTRLRPRSLSRNRKDRNSRSVSRQRSSDQSQSSSRKSMPSRSSSSVRSKSVSKRSRSKSRSRQDDSSSAEKPKSGFFRKLFTKRRTKPDDGTSVITDNASSKGRGSRSLGTSTSKPSVTSSLTESQGRDKFMPQVADAIPGVDEDRPALFFATDEVSTLTNPTIPPQKKSDEDPMGRYWEEPSAQSPTIDPFQEPFFSDPEGASPVKRSKSPQKTSLSVRRTFKDPSPRGYDQTRDVSNGPSPTPRSENRENVEGVDPPFQVKSSDETLSDVSSLTNKSEPYRKRNLRINVKSPPPPGRLRVSGIVQNTADEKFASQNSNSPTAVTPKARNLSLSLPSKAEQPPPAKSAARHDRSATASQSQVQRMSTIYSSSPKPFGAHQNKNKQPIRKQPNRDSSSLLLTSYSRGKLKNRKRAGCSSDSDEVKTGSVSSVEENLLKIPGYSKAFAVSNLRVKGKQPRGKDLESGCIDERDVRLTTLVVSKGFDLFRYQREYDIATGMDKRVVPVKAKSNKLKCSKSHLERPLNPVQLTGRRVLSKAAVPIQSNFRRFLAQKKAVDRMWALIEIQSYCRRWRAEAGLLATIVCTVTVQAMIRGYLVRRMCHQNFFAATQIQRVIRGYLSAASTFDSVYQVVLVQAQVRGWFTRRRLRKIYVEVREQLEFKASTKLQAWWRSRSARLHYQFLLVDTIIAQAVVRRHLASFHVKKLRSDRQFQSALVIQTVWRGHSAYNWFTQTLSALLIQKVWRGHTSFSKVRTLRSAIKIQAILRGYQTRSLFNVARAARKIQAAWRGYDAFSYFVAYMASRRIQCAWRVVRAQSNLKTFIAARTIQARWRGYADYWDYQAHNSARKIQAVFRTYIAYWDYKAHLASRTIQKTWRGHKSYSTTKKFTSTRRIQIAWRGFRARSTLRSHLSARHIQTTWRTHHAVANYTVNNSARKIQSVWLMHQAYMDYKRNRAAIKIQAIWRGFQGYTDFIFCLVDLLLLQRTVRKWLATKEARERRSQRAALRVQTSWRRHRHYSPYNKRLAAIRIQREWRCYSGYTNYILLLADVISVQCAIRCWFARLKVDGHRTSLAATGIQRTWRGWRVATAYTQHRSSITIQTTWRRHRIYWAFQHHMSSVRIQSFWRGQRQRRAYIQYSAARTLQKYWRRYNAYMYLLFSIANAMILQRTFRMYRAVKQKRNLQRSQAATKVQKIWRGYHTKCVVFEAIVESVQIEHASITIQKYWRRYATMSFLAYQIDQMTRHAAATTLQSCWRGHFAKVVVGQTLETVIRMQSVWRRHEAIRIAFDSRSVLVGQRDTSAASKIQRSWASHSMSKSCRMEIAATKVQSAWRMHFILSHYREFKAARRIQTIWRMISAQSTYNLFRASRKIQAQWRMSTERNDYRQLVASTKLQSIWRMHVAQVTVHQRIAEELSRSCLDTVSPRNFSRELKAAQKVQSFEQMRIHRLLYRHYMAARKIQTFWRMYIVKAMYIEFRCARAIQSCWRANFWRRRFHSVRSTAVVMQSIVRGNIARCEYQLDVERCIRAQSCARRFLASRNFNEMRIPDLLLLSKANALRERLAIEKIQFWWVVVLDCRKEKRAALVIERFFIKIKMDIEAEILRHEKKKANRLGSTKKENHTDDFFLDAAWEEALESAKSDSSSDIFNFSDDGSHGNHRVKPAKRYSAPPPRSTTPKIEKEQLASPVFLSHMPPQSPASVKSKSTVSSSSLTHSIRQSSPSRRLIMRHEKNRPPNLTGDSSLNRKYHRSSSRSSSRSRKSTKRPNSTTSSRGGSSALERAKAITRSHSLSSGELADNLSLEEAFLDAAADHMKEERIPIRNTNTAFPSKPFTVERFFADDLESLDDSTVVQINEKFTSPRPATIPEESPPPPRLVGSRTPKPQEIFGSPLSKRYAGNNLPLSTRSSSVVRGGPAAASETRRSKSTPRTKTAPSLEELLAMDSYPAKKPTVYRKKPREAKIYGTEYGMI